MCLLFFVSGVGECQEGDKVWCVSPLTWINLSERNMREFFLLIEPSYGVSIPEGDMKKRFGINHNGFLEVLYCVGENVTVGGAFNVLFGEDVREDTILDFLKTSHGFIIDQNGKPGEYSIGEHGYYVRCGFGMLFLFGNPLWMLHAGLSGGYIWHKIRIENVSGQIPQLREPFIWGYDRLSGGPALTLSLSIMHFHPYSIVRVRGGVEATIARTKNLRGYVYDARMYDGGTRTDVLITMRIGWIIAFSRKSDVIF